MCDAKLCSEKFWNAETKTSQSTTSHLTNLLLADFGNSASLLYFPRFLPSLSWLSFFFPFFLFLFCHFPWPFSLPSFISFLPSCMLFLFFPFPDFLSLFSYLSFRILHLCSLASFTFARLLLLLLLDCCLHFCSLAAFAFACLLPLLLLAYCLYFYLLIYLF